MKFLVCHNDKAELNQNFRYFLSCKEKAANKLQKKFPGVAKSWLPVTQGWHLPSHATPWLRAWVDETIIQYFQTSSISNFNHYFNAIKQREFFLLDINYYNYY